MSPAKSLGVLYLEKNKISFFCSTQNCPLEAVLSYDVIRDMNIVNLEKFIFTIRSFISQLKSPPEGVIIALSPDYTFDKEFPNDPLEEFTKNLDNYQSIIPFENISKKTLKTNKGWRASFTNKDLCENLKTAMERLNLVVVGIVPLSMLSPAISELSKGFNYMLLLDKMDLIRQFSFLRENQKESPPQTGSLIKNNTLGLILAIVLFSIAAILIFYLLTLK